MHVEPRVRVAALPRREFQLLSRELLRRRERLYLSLQLA